MSNRLSRRKTLRDSFKKGRQRNTEELLKLEEKKLELAREHNELELAILNQELQFRMLKMASYNEVLNVLSEEEEFEDFREKCHRIVRRFEHFVKVFDSDYKQIMESGKLKEPEKLNEASRTLLDFSMDIQNLTIISDDGNLKEIQETVIRKVFGLDETLRNLRMEIGEGREDFKGGFRRVIGKSKYSKKVDEIKKMYGDAKAEVLELKEIVQKFNIPPSNRMKEVARRQFEILSTEIPKLPMIGKAENQALKPGTSESLTTDPDTSEDSRPPDADAEISETTQTSTNETESSQTSVNFTTDSETSEDPISNADSDVSEASEDVETEEIMSKLSNFLFDEEDEVEDDLMYLVFKCFDAKPKEHLWRDDFSDESETE